MDAESSEFATEPVPDHATVPWYSVAFVAAMVAFSLPTFLTGLEVAVVTTPKETISILIYGAIILTVIGSVTGAIGASTRLSSYMLNRVAFGQRGAAIVNLAFAVSLLGWFGVNIDLFSGAVIRLALELFDTTLPAWPIELFAGIIMTITTVFGFRAINFLSTLLVPVLIVVTYLLLSGAFNATSLESLLAIETQPQISFGDGVSSVVGAVIVGCVILPDITRFIGHWRGAVYTAVITYFFIDIVVTGAGGMAAASLQDDDLLNIMVTLGLGWAAFAIVIFGSWVLNSLNLYSTMLSVESTVPRLNNTVLIVVTGALGTLAAFLNILDYFLDFLFYLAIVFVPVAGVIAIDYLFLRRNAYHGDSPLEPPELRPGAVAAWALGAFVSLAGSFGWFTLTGIAAIDAVLVAAALYLIIHTAAHRNKAGTGESSQ